MANTLAAEPVPITIGSDQVMRVQGTRVELETIVFAFEAGATAEDIAQDYPSLALNDVYAVITYFLRHRGDVEVYLQRRRAEAERLRETIESRYRPLGLRERLQARVRKTP